VTVIKEKLYKKLESLQLQKCTKFLSKEVLNVQGQFTGTLTHSDNSAEQEIYAVKGLCKPLIGPPAIMALSKVNLIDSVKQQVVDQHPELFQGLGTIEGEYSIKLKSDAKPYALATPRRIPSH